MIIKERQSKILKIPKEYMVKNPPAPKSAKIELVSRCNYRCKFCAFALREEQPNQDMNHSLFKNICEELKSVGVEEIGLFYIGESFLNPDLLYKAIKFCKNKMKFPYVFLTSNASMALPQHVE
jgi:MoaA/NifB/PqqE/SkfB family radical SAM enzyme